MRKFYKKIVRISSLLVILLWGIIFSIGLSLYVLTHTEKGQNWTTAQINGFLSSYLDADVHIEGFFYEPINHFVIENALILDHHQDTLLYFKKAEVDFTALDLRYSSLIFQKTVFTDLSFYLKNYKGEDYYNYYPVFQRFLDKEDGEEPGIYRILSKEVVLKNAKFKLIFEERDEPNQPIDYKDMEVYEINGHLSYFQVVNYEIKAEVAQLSLKEKSGFRIDDFRSNVQISSSHMNFEGLSLKTPYTTWSGHYLSNYNGYEQVAYDFFEKVNFQANFENARIDAYDLAYFNSNIPQTSKVFGINGIAYGKVSDLRSERLKLNFGQNSALDFSMHMAGMPNYDEARMDFNFQHSNLDFKDVKHYFLAGQDELPEEAYRLGTIHFNANFFGFLDDFVADGKFNTALGSIGADLNLKNGGKPSEALYSGKLNLNDFNLAAFTNDDRFLRKTTMSGDIKGKGLVRDELWAHLSADFQYFDFLDYRYKNLQVNGDITNQIFDGALVVDDENLDMDFLGKIYFADSIPAFNFTAEVNYANLFELGLSQDTLNFKSEMDLNFSGNRLDNLVGNLTFYGAELALSKFSYAFDSLNLISELTAHQRKLSLNSEIADMQFKGDFQLSETADIVKYSFSEYFSPGFFEVNPEKVNQSFFDFDIHLKRASFLMELISPELIVDDNTFFKGRVSPKEGSIDLNLSMPGIYFNNIYVRKIEMESSGKRDDFEILTSIDRAYQGDSILFNNAMLRTKKQEDSVLFNLYLADAGYENQLTLNLLTFIEKKQMGFKVLPSEATVLDTLWTISSSWGSLDYKSRVVDLGVLEAKTPEQKLSLSGDIGPDTSHSLRLLVDEVYLHTAHPFLPTTAQIYDGKLLGQLVVKNLYQQAYFSAAFVMSPAIANEDTIGALSFLAGYDNVQKSIYVDSRLHDNDQDLIAQLSGEILPYDDMRLDLFLELMETPANLAEVYFSDYISAVEGTMTAGIGIGGKLGSPALNGKVNIENAAFLVDYLQTRYELAHEIDIKENKIAFKDLILKDENGKEAVAEGEIAHHYFSDFRFDIHLLMENVKVLNTTVEDNDLFYGQGYGSGKFSVTGPLDDIVMTLNAKTEKNTKINLPISYAGDASGHNYISFTDNVYFQESGTALNLRGITFIMDIEITPDADAQIIFDPSIGDLIKGNGKGNLRLEVSSSGEFSIFGDYIIANGDYFFSALGLINKKFKIYEGSSISWSGDPYEAEIDLSAAYETRASLRELMMTDRGEASATQKVPVDALLKLKGSLFSPDIEMDFKIKELSALAQSEIRQAEQTIRNDEEELNKQVISLLMMNRFVPLDNREGITASNALNSSITSGVGDLISNQVSHWLSKLSYDVKYLENLQVGVNYRTGVNPTLGMNEQELEVAMSTNVFNDRISISGSYVAAEYAGNPNANSTGNFEVSYKATEDGKIRLKVFSRSTINPIYYDNINTQGVGVFFVREFDSWDEFFKRSRNEVPEEPSGKKQKKQLENKNLDELEQELPEGWQIEPVPFQ